MTRNVWTMQGALLVTLVAMGCGGSSAERPVTQRPTGQVQAAPAMTALPHPTPRRWFTRHMHLGWMLAEESLEVSAPTAPESTTTESQTLEQWTQEVLKPWLKQKIRSVKAARAELDAAAEEKHEQRILAGAVVGLLYEDIARVLASIPVPDDLRSDPEIAEIYKEVVEAQARPYLKQAQQAYKACAANAVRPQSMRNWSVFCAGRAEALPMPAPAGNGQGSTVVTVFAE